MLGIRGLQLYAESLEMRDGPGMWPRQFLLASLHGVLKASVC